MGRQRDILADRELIRSWASEENGEKLILDDEYDVLIQALVRLSHKDRVWLASMAQSVPSWLQRQIDNCIENVQHVEKVRELMDLEKEWKNAYVQRDLVALDRIEAVDFILTDSLRNTLEKAQDIEEVKSGVYTAIVSSQVLDEGIDVPEANIGIILSGTGSLREYTQRLGRILRPTEKKAILYEVISKGTAEIRTAARRSREE